MLSAIWDHSGRTVALAKDWGSVAVAEVRPGTTHEVAQFGRLSLEIAAPRSADRAICTLRVEPARGCYGMVYDGAALADLP